MSVIGISPTDIVKGVKTFKEAATALTSGPEGARQQYRDARETLSSLEEAVADLDQYSPSAAPAACIYSELLERERRFQATLKSYDPKLGRNSQARTWKSMKRKLQYAFDGASKVQKHIINSKPGVDAALFDTMRFVFSFQLPRDYSLINDTESRMK